MVHSIFINVNNSNCDISLNINFENRNIKANVLKRPGVDEFLEKMSNLYEIVIFTASLSQYAIPLIEQLDKKKFVILNYLENIVLLLIMVIQKI